MSDTNPALRDHVLRTGFDLSLGKTHVMALVWLDLYLAEESPDWREQSRDYHPLRQPRVMAHSITGLDGLYRRGLAENTWLHGPGRDPDATVHDVPPCERFRITDAGHLVIGLLREAGIYDEYAALVPLRTEAS